MNPKELIQGTDEWKEYKLGKVGSSTANDILPNVKNGKPKASRKNLMAKLICERMTDTWEESFQSGPMQRGNEMEASARSAFEAESGLMVTEEGFKNHPAIEGFGCSPDGVIYENGKAVSGLEIKCPNTATHLDTITSGTWNRDYTVQMHVAMCCYDVPSWYFASFDDRFGLKPLWYKEVKRDEGLISQIENEVRMFLAELEAAILILRSY